MANRFVPAPYTLEKGDLGGDTAVRWAIHSPLGSEYLVQVVSGDNVLKDPIAILRLAPRIKGVDPCCDNEGRGVEEGFVAVRLNLDLESTRLTGYLFQRTRGHDFDLRPSAHLLNLIVYHTGKALVAFL